MNLQTSSILWSPFQAPCLRLQTFLVAHATVIVELLLNRNVVLRLIWKSNKSSTIRHISRASKGIRKRTIIISLNLFHLTIKKMHSKDRVNFRLMQELDPYICFLQAYDLKTLHGNANILIVWRKYAYTSYVTLILMSLIATVLLQGWLCVVTGLEMDKTATAIGGVISSSQIFFIYISLARKRELIGKALSHWQQIINTRKLRWR